MSQSARSYAGVFVENGGEPREDFVAQRKPEIDQNREFLRLELLEFSEKTNSNGQNRLDQHRHQQNAHKIDGIRAPINCLRLQLRENKPKRATYLHTSRKISLNSAESSAWKNDFTNENSASAESVITFYPII